MARFKAPLEATLDDPTRQEWLCGKCGFWLSETKRDHAYAAISTGTFDQQHFERYNFSDYQVQLTGNGGLCRVCGDITRCFITWEETAA